MKTSENYNILDLTKFVFAFAVIAIHTHICCNSKQVIVEIINQTLQYAVPFFFVVSGYFLGKKLFLAETATEENLIYRKYLKRIAYMYIIWSIIYLPINLYYDIYKFGFSFLFATFDILRGWLFVGQNEGSWQLWYLLASLVGVCVIALFRRFNTRFELIFALSIMAFMIGLLYQEFHETISISSWGRIIVFIYDKIFRFTRNGIFVGWAFLMCGIMLARWNFNFKKSLIIICGGAILCFVNTDIAMIPITLGFVGLSINVPVSGSNTFFVKLRKLSIMIYLLHMLVVFLFLRYFQFGDMLLFIWVSLVTLICSLFFLYISKYRLFKFLYVVF